MRCPPPPAWLATDGNGLSRRYAISWPDFGIAAAARGGVGRRGPGEIGDVRRVGQRAAAADRGNAILDCSSILLSGLVLRAGCAPGRRPRCDDLRAAPKCLRAEFRQ